MNTVEYVNIGGYAFSLESDAYAKVKEYLDELEAFYNRREGGREIMEGIEERFAELLLERCPGGTVATVANVDDIIGLLGRPETIEEEASDTEESGSRKQENVRQEKTRKRLFRNVDDKLYGGVSSGIAAYFNIDVVLVRIIWAILLCLGLALFSIKASWVILAYVVLWIAMPGAHTVSDRCSMKGGSLGIGDIEKSVGSGERKAESAIVHSDFWPVFWRIVGVCVGLLLFIIGSFLLLAGVAAVFGLNIASTTVTELLHGSLGLSLDGILPIAMASISWKAVKIAALFSYFTPCIGLLYLGLKLIFNFREPSWQPGLVILLIWILAMVTLAVLASIGAFSGVINI